MSNSETEEEFMDAPVANPESFEEGTMQMETEQTQSEEGEPEIDYKKKFTESSSEAQRLYKENQELKNWREEQSSFREQAETTTTDENLYPGFEDLDEEAQQNLLNYTNSVKQSVKQDLYKDPAIVYGKQMYNEKRWNDAFESVSVKFPDLKDQKSDFKREHFKPNDVPDNIDTLLEGMAKIFLYDRSHDNGVMEERQRANRIDTARTRGGDKTPKTNRTLEEWTEFATRDPLGFSNHSKEYDEDMASGRLKE